MFATAPTYGQAAASAAAPAEGGARAAAPARVRKVLDVPKSSDVHGHEELGRDVALRNHNAAFRRTRNLVDTLEVGAQKARGAFAIVRAIAKAKDVE